MAQEGKEPIFFQDVVTPKETEQAPEGFDLDREFGKGTRAAVENELRRQFWSWFSVEGNQMDKQRALVNGADPYFILFGKRFWSEKEQTRMEKAVRDSFQRQLADRSDLSVVFAASSYRTVFGDAFWNRNEERQMAEALKRNSESAWSRGDIYGAATLASFYRTLVGDNLFVEEEKARVVKALNERVTNAFLAGDSTAAWAAAHLRILRAHDIKFIPGKGIEIIDTPPPQFQQTPIPPMPEERKF